MTEVAQGSNTEPTVQTSDSAEQKTVTVVKGKPKSGRVWKREKNKFSSIIDVKQLKSKWAVKEERRQKLKQIKERERLAREEKERKLQEEKERIKKRREMREQNALKNVKYQIVTDTAKLKKVSKKQWKNYRKLADINKY